MRGVLLCLLSAGLLGVQMPLAKYSYETGADPYSFALFRAAAAAVLFFALALMKGMSLKVQSTCIVLLVIVALSNGTISFGYLGALERISPSLAAMIFYLYPLIVLIVSAIRESRLPRFAQAAALVLAFSGLGLVFGPTFQSLDLIGVAMGAFAAIGAASYFLLVPAAAQRISALVMMGWINLIVALIFIPLFWAEGQYAPVSLQAEIAFWAGVAAYAVGLGLTVPAIALAGSVRASLLFNFEPVTVVLVSAIFLVEVLSGVQYLGIAAVLIALVLASGRRRSETSIENAETER